MIQRGMHFSKIQPRIFRVLEHWVDSLPFADPDLVGVTKGIMRVVIQKIHLNLQFPLYPKIIRIQKGDIFPPGMKNPSVSGSAHSFVPGMSGRVSPYPRIRFIASAVPSVEPSSTTISSKSSRS